MSRRLVLCFILLALIVACWGCRREAVPMQVHLGEQTFASVEAFDAFADHYPDSAIYLLYNDLKNSTHHPVDAEQAYKILRYGELIFENHYYCDNDSLFRLAADFYDQQAEKKSDVFLQNRWNVARVNYILGRTLQTKYEYVEAMERFVAGLTILDEWFENSSQANINRLRGLLYFYMGESCYDAYIRPASIELYNKSLEIFLKFQDSVYIARNYWVMADFLEIQRPEMNEDSCITIAYKGLQYVNEKNAPFETAMLLGIIGHNFRFHGQYDSAVQYFRKSIKIIPKQCDELHILYTSLGFVFFKQEKYDSALQYTLKGFEAKKINRRSAAAVGLSKIYHALNEPEKASFYSKEAIEMKSSISLIRSENSSVLDVFMIYNNHLQKVRKNHFRIITILIITGITIIVVAISFVMIRKILKRRLQKQKELLLFDPEHQKMEIYQDRWNKFYQSDIYQYIMKNNPQGEILTEEKLKAINRGLNAKEWDLLKSTIDSIFDNFTLSILTDYDLTENELKYIYISFFNITEYQKAALSILTYKGLTSRAKRLATKIDNQDIKQFISYYLYQK